MPEPNADQSACIDDIFEFYHATGEFFYTLEGWAGVGKTFTIQRAIKKLQQAHPNMNIAVTAPTNKAVKVLAEMAQNFGLDGIILCTIYSSLGLVLDSNGEEKETKRMVEGNFEDMDLVIIDEGSMMSRRLCEIVAGAAQMAGVKVVIMGDSFQLPPVKEAESPAFTMADRRFRLTKIMRQEDGNPILELVADLRRDIADGTENTRFHDAFNSQLDQGIFVMNAVDWYNSVKENFTDPEYQKNPDMFRILAWRNERVNALNRSIRRLLVGETESPFIKGERVLARAPILEPGSPPTVVVNTDDECDVLEVYEQLHPDFEGMSEQFKVWTCLLMSPRGASVEAHLLHDDSRKDYHKMCNHLADVAKKDRSQWRHFWAFKDSFADLQPPHALTVHRSQGSTYENVFLDIRDCYRNEKRRERKQLLYVGCSRASQNLLILKP